ncbi:MAG: hypothetical protein RIR70_1777 [Pseudomonadota bacterium]
MNHSGTSHLFLDGGQSAETADPAEVAPQIDPWDAHAALDPGNARRPARGAFLQGDQKLRAGVRKLHLQPGQLLFAVRVYPNLREIELSDYTPPANWPQQCAMLLPGGEVMSSGLSDHNPWRIIRFGGPGTEFPEKRLLHIRVG